MDNSKQKFIKLQLFPKYTIILTTFGFETVFSAYNSLKNLVGNTKNKVDVNKKPGIYEIRCSKDLQNYLDKSTQGVIYFSLGSNVKSANLTVAVREIIVGALSELPYNVLWKWETDHLPDQPKNVLTRKWLPQQDLLGHKNIKAFVTQGGLQSMEEAITNGVPLIGMPFFADQPLNVMKMVKMGIAQSVDYATMTKDGLKGVIVEVAENDRYTKKVRELRDLLVDQPMNGLDKAIWWIEYVIRHKGARHLKSPAVDMPWYEYFLLDVAVFVLGSLGFLAYFLFVGVKVFRDFVVNGRSKIKIN